MNKNTNKYEAVNKYYVGNIHARLYIVCNRSCPCMGNAYRNAYVECEIWYIYVCQLRIFRITKFLTSEPEDSSPYSQETTTSPYPELTGSTLHPLANLPKIHSNIILLSTSWSYKWSLSFWLSHQNLEHIPLLYHACHMSRPPHSPLFELPNDIWGWVQNMKLLIVQRPPF
jgi:hypothetical protein